MKMQKFSVVLLFVAISLFVVACDGDSMKESSGTANKNEFSVVGTNIVQEVCEYYLKAVDVTTRIEPSIITGIYSYYDVQSEGNTYIDITLDVKNLNNEAKMTDDLITAKIKINSNEYTCFSVVESADGSDLENHASIKPLETRVIHYLAEVPLREATGEIEVILTVNGKDFSNKFNLESIKTTSPSVEDSVEKELEDADTNPDTQEDPQKDAQHDGTEDEYYIIIKEAWQRQKDYIDSIADPTVKKSVQTPESAAILESIRLLIEHPGDSKAIDISLRMVLNGE